MKYILLTYDHVRKIGESGVIKLIEENAIKTSKFHGRDIEIKYSFYRGDGGNAGSWQEIMPYPCKVDFF